MKQYLVNSLKEATETVGGWVRRATQEETNGLAVNNRYVSPLRLGGGFSVLKAQNGYLIFPGWLGGVVVQWGYTPVDASSTTITFPVAFPGACRSVVCTARQNQVGGVGTDHAVKTAPTLGNVVLSTVSALTGVYWVAWGH